ncbi:STAS domain-containing protein [Xanthomonas sp. WHRI 1810A]|uniref:STAS domain-containing protein n=1 Tax=Xanthomonas sp. WHRI 1810A TaxID=3161565 RepID=UPI0032E91F3F
MIVATRQNGITLMAVHGEMTVYTAAELAAAWRPWLADPQSWELDLAQVPEMDGAGLQLLLLVQRELSAAGVALTLIALSPAVEQALTLCRLASQFQGQHRA